MLKVQSLEIGEMFGPTKRKLKMTTRTITAECSNCESSYEVQYEEEMVSDEFPEICPFCGDPIEEFSESEYIEDDDSDIDDDEWTN